MNVSFEQQVRQRAYELWLSDGMKSGRELDHWFAAERELAGRYGQVEAAAPIPTKAVRKSQSKKSGRKKK